jgi:hypothetical protein
MQRSVQHETQHGNRSLEPRHYARTNHPAAVIFRVTGSRPLCRWGCSAAPPDRGTRTAFKDLEEAV